MKINHQELKKMIEKVYMKKKSMFIWGPTGIGKSYVVREVSMEIAKKLGLEFSDRVEDMNDPNKFVFVDIRLTSMDASDIRGLPVIEKVKNNNSYVVKGQTESESGDVIITKWIAPDILPRRGYGMIFLDELNLAMPSIQASAYQLILDRRVGTYVLPDGYGIISAGNRAEDKAYVYEMADPLKNRFIHVELEKPVPESGNLNSGWLRWAMTHNIDHRIISYIARVPSDIFVRNDSDVSPAFPTPRSWAILSDMIKDVTDYREISIWAKSIIGDVTGSKFAKYVQLAEELDINEYLKNPELIKNIMNVDIYWALLGMMIEMYKTYMNRYVESVGTEKAKATKRIFKKKVSEMLAVLSNMGTEFVVRFVTGAAALHRNDRKLNTMLVDWIETLGKDVADRAYNIMIAMGGQ